VIVVYRISTNDLRGRLARGAWFYALDGRRLRYEDQIRAALASDGEVDQYGP
jgi:hypothetical protein